VYGNILAQDTCAYIVITFEFHPVWPQLTDSQRPATTKTFRIEASSQRRRWWGQNRTAGWGINFASFPPNHNRSDRSVQVSLAISVTFSYCQRSQSECSIRILDFPVNHASRPFIHSFAALPFLRPITRRQD